MCIRDRSLTSNGLTTTSDIIMSNTTRCNITASSTLNLFSNSISLNANTTNSNGSFLTMGTTTSILFGTNDSINTYIDLVLSFSISSRKIRMDSRPTSVFGANSILMGGSHMNLPSFAVNDSFCCVANQLSIGPGYSISPLPGAVLCVNGKSYFYNDIACSTNINLTHLYLLTH